MIPEILTESLLGAILISGLVTVMMMMVECLNISTGGSFLARLSSHRVGQVVVSALLGVIPGCMGGFASVSLYAHGMLSFGALTAMMIASSGDEAFAMLAMFPGRALWVFLILLLLGIAVGILVDALGIKAKGRRELDCDRMKVHEEDHTGHTKGHGRRHFGWKRIILLTATAAFAAALGFGLLEHDGDGHGIAGVNLLSEEWLNIVFAVLSLAVLAVIAFASDHFVEEHLFHHVAARHLPKIFAWSLGVLLTLGLMNGVFDVNDWISGNTALMILLATAIGIIPESGPHLIFVTLYAAGIVPLPVLLASSISQDGHAALPLLAESKQAFLKSKAVCCAAALLVGFATMLLGF